MYVDISKNAVLFYKALEDIWCAERTYYGSPNNAVWSCCQAATIASVYNLARYDQRLRYKNLKTDPAPEDARSTIEDVKLIFDEFAKHPKCAGFVGEAKEVHAKMLHEIKKTKLSYS